MEQGAKNKFSILAAEPWNSKKEKCFLLNQNMYWNELNPCLPPPLLSKTFCSKGILSRFCQKSKRKEGVYSQNQWKVMFPFARRWEHSDLDSGALFSLRDFEIMSFTSWKSILTTCLLIVFTPVTNGLTETAGKKKYETQKTGRKRVTVWSLGHSA